jgi:short-chain fatty acids transporter
MTGTSQARRPAAPPARETGIARIALRFTAFTEKWLPDAFGFVLVGTALVLVLGLVTGESLVGSPKDPTTATSGFGLIDAWGKGFWDLIDFTLQMAMIVIGGYVVATSPPVARLIVRLARVPKSPRTAIAYVAAVAMVASYLNWAFSLVFAAILAREVARNVRGVDYRALGAMAFIGLGTVWAQGLSGSAALQVASAASSPPPVQEVVKANGFSAGTIPLSDTIFLWQSVVATLVVFVVAVAMAWFLAPTGDRAHTAEDMGVTLRPLIGEGAATPGEESDRPGDWLERSPVMGLFIAALALVYVVRHFADQDNPITALDLNTINMILLIGALVLHWRPRRLVAAVREGAGAASGVLLQFPFYGGIFGMIVYTGLSQRIAGWLVSASSEYFFPPIIAIYSCVLGVFVPSGGSKWVIEAPYVLDAANQLHVHAGWMVVVYDLGEASANLLQPFWMLPTLAVLGLKARDIMGYTFTMFLVLFPVVLVLVTVLAPHVTP